MYFTGLESLRGSMFVDVQRCFKCLWWAYNHAGYVLQAVYDTLELSVASRTFLVAEIWLFEHASKTTCKKIENFGKILNWRVKTFFQIRWTIFPKLLAGVQGVRKKKWFRDLRTFDFFRFPLRTKKVRAKKFQSDISLECEICFAQNFFWEVFICSSCCSSNLGWRKWNAGELEFDS